MSGLWGLEVRFFVGCAWRFLSQEGKALRDAIDSRKSGTSQGQLVAKLPSRSVQRVWSLVQWLLSRGLNAKIQVLPSTQMSFFLLKLVSYFAGIMRNRLVWDREYVGEYIVI